MINNDLGISKSEFAKRVGKSEKTIQRIVHSLIKKDVVARVGSNKTGHWEVVK